MHPRLMGLRSVIKDATKRVNWLLAITLSALACLLALRADYQPTWASVDQHNLRGSFNCTNSLKLNWPQTFYPRLGAESRSKREA